MEPVPLPGEADGANPAALLRVRTELALPLWLDTGVGLEVPTPGLAEAVAVGRTTADPLGLGTGEGVLTWV